MTVLGTVATALSVLCAVLALRGSSDIQRRLAEMGSRAHRAARTSPVRDATMARLTGGLAGAFAGSVLALALPLGPVPIAVCAYLGGIAPSVVTERQGRRMRNDAERGMVTLVEWLHALVACGRPLETAVDGVARHGSGSALLDAALARAQHDYTLGIPMHQALARAGAASQIRGLIELAQRVERARDLGRGALPLLADLRDELRARERAQALEAASHVEGKLTLVLTLCYLPALALLVIIPLFLTLLTGLFG